MVGSRPLQERLPTTHPASADASAGPPSGGSLASVAASEMPLVAASDAAGWRAWSTVLGSDALASGPLPQPADATQ
jgi:hypothetical protein